MEDIIPLIIAQVSDQSTLHALTLVNKYLNGIANTRLYNTVQLSSWKRIHAFFTSSNTQLLDKVKHLELEIGDDSKFPSSTGDISTISVPPAQNLLSIQTFHIMLRGYENYDKWIIPVGILKIVQEYFIKFEPQHFRAAYQVNDISRQCPIKLFEIIMEMVCDWTTCLTLDLPSVSNPILQRLLLDQYDGIGGWNYFLLPVKSLSVSGACFDITFSGGLIEDWLVTSPVNVLGPNYDKEKKAHRDTVMVEVRAPIDAPELGSLEGYLEGGSGRKLFKVVVVGEERENEDVEVWRNRVLNEKSSSR